jgi:hypothetical protein
MLIYLDANIVQYCADYENFIFGSGDPPSTFTAKLLSELVALRELIELELKIEQMDFENRWDVVAPSHLIRELFSGRPTDEQRRVYRILQEAWVDCGQEEHIAAKEDEIAAIEKSLRPLGLKDVADRWHLAQAIALGASWFLTNDGDILEKTRQKPSYVGKNLIGIAPTIGIVQGVRVGRPSECIKRLSFDPVFGFAQIE